MYPPQEGLQRVVHFLEVEIVQMEIERAKRLVEECDKEFEAQNIQLDRWQKFLQGRLNMLCPHDKKLALRYGRFASSLTVVRWTSSRPSRLSRLAWLGQ